MKRAVPLALALATFGCACVLCGAAPVPSGPEFTADGALVRPAAYREWVFVGSGLGMTYGPNARPAGQPQMFTNVYAEPEAYRAFMRTGTWPEGATFVIEGRASVDRELLANHGQTQGDASFMEASVKDSARFPEGGWGYFDFGSERAPVAQAKPIPTSADCYACHAQNTAVDNTFVQFYPALLEVARARGTIEPTFDPKKRF